MAAHRGSRVPRRRRRHPPHPAQQVGSPPRAPARPRRRAALVAPLALVALALAARLVGLGWGLPEIFEEAYPFKTAVRMWGFDGRGVDLNPHFFRYPSLVFDLEFLLLGFLRAVWDVAGWARDDAHFRALIAAQPTPFYLAGRGLVAVLGALTAWPAWALGRRAGGPLAGLLAGAWVALSPFLVGRSQVIEVDVPLAFLVTLALAAIVGDGRFDRPDPARRVVLGGALAGLAASAKYPGVVVLVPLLVALALRAGAERGRLARQAGVALLACAVTFLATSPFVLLDLPNALAGIEAERIHLARGHFGGESGPAWGFYAAAWFTTLLGWLPGLLALGGLVVLAAVHRAPWAITLGSFVLALVLASAVWQTRHERYLLAAVPAALVFAAAAAAALARRVRRAPARIALAGALLVLGIVLPVDRWSAHARRLGPDSRTEARLWIERHLPAGSLLVIEPYGPNPPSPLSVRVEDGRGGDGGPLFWVVPAPMFQSGPERSATTYDPRLHVSADAWVVSAAVRDRYRADPARFPGQNAFYDWLAASWTEAARFRATTGSGAEIVIYRNPAFDRPFGGRVARPVPPTEFMRRTGGRGGEATWYMTLGVNYLAFGHPREAAACFRMALSFPVITGGATREQLVDLLARASAAETGL